MFWRSSRCARLAVLQMALAAATPAAAQSSLSGDPIRMSRAADRITIDGDLNDEGWRGATRIDRWYETNPGDNTEPKVRNVGYLTYDDRFSTPASSSTIRPPTGSARRTPIARSTPSTPAPSPGPSAASCSSPTR
jgi:hypothetical protein